MRHASTAVAIRYLTRTIEALRASLVRWWYQRERAWRRRRQSSQASGRAFRVIRRKNPSRSMVVYRDDWQVALLPDRCQPAMDAP